MLPLGVLGNIAYTWLGTDRALLDSLDALPHNYLLAALALTLVPWITGTLRLLVWSRFLGYRLPLMELLRMTLVVDLGSAVSPTAIGGEAFRWGMLVRYGVKPGQAATLALMPKLEDAVFFLIALPAAIVWTAAWRLPVVASSTRLLSGNVLSVLVGAAVVGLVAWLLSRAVLLGRGGIRVRRFGLRFWGRSRRRLRRTMHDARAAFVLIAKRGKARFALTLMLTALHWLARYSVISALALFLGVPFDPVLFWLLQWVVFTIMSFVPTPGATGGAEVAFTAVYATLLPSGFIGVATAAWRMFTFYVPVGLAALLFALLGRVRLDRAGTAPENQSN
ncbi:MAG TPA: lysylphosphatidylglycerol synthase transmembrane domain-containing protein [Longimicrobiales bacterium]|nr:lysylphosphatidylglycerol synthase transmembrane domain-containing protein [Longimicrobiales bacterium]